MKRFIVACCILASVAAIQDKKISLEDIERDNLRATQKSPRTLPVPQQDLKPPTDYGFVPVKTANDYLRQQPKDLYVQPQYVAPSPSQQNHYVPPAQRYNNQGYNTLKYSVPIPTQQYSTGAQDYSPPVQQYSQPAQPQVQAQPQLQQQYFYQPQAQPQQAQYQQFENVQYIADNSIAQASQQYYSPQYVYLQPSLQQYTAPSTAIQTVVDPKGGVQYVMYIPTYAPKAEQSQNYENVVYTDDSAAPTGQVEYQPQEQPQVPAVQPQAEYVVPSVAHQQQITQNIQYAAEPLSKTRYFSTKHEPKSLLDSYVPSYVQLQYLKQQQQQAHVNAIAQQSAKSAPAQSVGIGKVVYAKRSSNNNNNRESLVETSPQNSNYRQH